MDDLQIIEMFNQRNEKAISETETKYGKKCRMLSYNILNNLQDSEECANDSYLVLWNRIPPEAPKNLCAYLLKIVRNLSLKRYEYNTAAKRNSHFDLALDELESVIGDKSSPDEKIIAEDLGEQINCFLHSLPEEHRKIFMQRYWYGCSVKKIADENYQTPHNVSVKLSRIRSQLKIYLNERGYEI